MHANIDGHNCVLAVVMQSENRSVCSLLMLPVGVKAVLNLSHLGLLLLLLLYCWLYTGGSRLYCIVLPSSCDNSLLVSS